MREIEQIRPAEPGLFPPCEFGACIESEEKSESNNGNQPHSPDQTSEELQKLRSIIEEEKNQGSNEHEPSERSIVVVDYDGNLSQHMQWNIEKIENPLRNAHFRSTVRITKGDEQLRSTYSELTNVAILRPTWDAFRQFQEFFNQNKHYSVEYDLNRADMTIRIHDQLITQEALSAHGAFRHEFMTRFNRVLYDSLVDVLWTEKSYQTFVASLISGGAIVTTATPLLGASYLLKSGIADIPFHINNLFSNQKPPDTLVSFFNDFLQSPEVTIIKFASGITLSSMGLVAGVFWSDLSRQIRERSLYFPTGWDFVPFKHVKDGLVGQFKLRTSKHSLVELQRLS